jgi:hypothetical protein
MSHELEEEDSMLAPPENIYAVVSKMQQKQVTSRLKTKTQGHYESKSLFDWSCKWCKLSKTAHVGPTKMCPNFEDKDTEADAISLGLGHIDYGSHKRPDMSFLEAIYTRDTTLEGGGGGTPRDRKDGTPRKSGCTPRDWKVEETRQGSGESLRERAGGTPREGLGGAREREVAMRALPLLHTPRGRIGRTPDGGESPRERAGGTPRGASISHVLDDSITTTSSSCAGWGIATTPRSRAQGMIPCMKSFDNGCNCVVVEGLGFRAKF